MNPYRHLMDFLDDNGPGLDGPPSNWRHGTVRDPRGIRDLHLHTDNDAFGLDGTWVYDDDPRKGRDARVSFSMSRGEAHRLAWWIVRWWAAEWFGLRRWLYYWALRKHLDIVAPDRHREATR